MARIYHAQPLPENEDHDSGTGAVHPADREYNEETHPTGAFEWRFPAIRATSNIGGWNLRHEDLVYPLPFAEAPEASDNDNEPALEWFDIRSGPDGQCIVAECGLVPDRFVGRVEHRLRELYGLPVQQYPFPQNFEASSRALKD
jgi:hypothetical protein